MTKLCRYSFLPTIVALASMSWSSSAQEVVQNFDLGFEAKIREFPAVVRRADASVVHDIQRAFAQESFDYYLLHPSTTTGANAAQAAFRIWRDLGATIEMVEALQNLPSEFPVWGAILQSVAIAFERSSERQAYIEVLTQLEAALTDAIPQSEVQFRLGEAYFSARQDNEAAERFEIAIKLNPDSVSGRSARTSLHEIRNLGIGQIAPEFEVTTLSGESFALSHLRGQPVLLEFWATWCAPCIAEIPNLKEISNEHPELRIVGISLDDDLDKLSWFLETEPLPWIQISEPRGIQGKLAELFNTSALPRSLLLDSSGRIVGKNLRGNELAMKVSELAGAAQD